MPCSVAITSVNGIVPSGQSDPTVLRVTGTAFQCASGQVTVSSSISATSAPATVDANGRFRAEVAINASSQVHCGDLIQVRAECVGQPNCADQKQSLPLECCEIVTVFFQATTPFGQFNPTQLTVQGVVRGCPVDVIQVTSDVSAGAVPVNLDPMTGAFSVALPITPTNPTVKCGDKVKVTVSCPSGLGCEATVDNQLTCVDCYRAAVTVTSSPCIGTAPNQLQPVTLSASIAIDAGATQIFVWDFGDGTSGAPFTVNNASGQATTQYPHVESHDYAPGTYNAVLQAVGKECEGLKVTVLAQCGAANCPTITVDPPQVSNQCVNGKRNATLTTHVAATPGQMMVGQWAYGDGSVGTTIVASAGTTQTDAQSHDYLPGTYTATLHTIVPAGCPDQTLQIVVAPCSPPPCSLMVQSITTQVGPCDPNTGMRTVTATGAVNNNDPSDLYFWQWDATPAQVGLPAAQGVTQQHDYPAPGSGPITYNVTLTVVRNGNCVSSLTKQVTVDGCGSKCPQVTALNMTPGTCVAGATTRPVTLSATTSGSGVSTYEWNFGDGSAPAITTTPTAPVHNYAAPGSFSPTVTLHAPGCADYSLSMPFTVAACPPATTPTTPPSTSLPSCAALLWAAIIFMLVGGLMSVIGCVLAHAFPQAGLIVGIIGVVLFAIGALLFLIWWIVCRFFTACAVILAVRSFVMVLIFIFGIIALVLALISIFGTVSYALCAAASAAYGLAWGMILALLDTLAQSRGCIIINPSGGSGAGSSSGPLTSSDFTRKQALGMESAPPYSSNMSAPVEPGDVRAQPLTGMGDAVKRATGAFGIQPCAKCHERAQRLNALVPFGSASASSE